MFRLWKRQYHPAPLSIPDFLQILKKRPLLSEQESWDLYKSFIRNSSTRIPLEPWHFGSFMNMLFQPFIPSYSRYGMEPLEISSSCLRKFEQIKQDFDSMGLKADQSINSSIIQSKIFLGKEANLENEVDIDTYNMILKQIKNPTKRSVWDIYTQIKKAKQVPNLYTFEWFIYYFGSVIRDPKATNMIFTKMGHSQFEFRHETFVLYIDALGEIGADVNMLNKLLYRYKKDPALPVVGKKEDLIQVMLKFWINQQKPNPCFKLFQIAQKNNVILSLESIGYILDACYLFDRKEPVAGLELVEPVAVKMVENGSSWKYLELLLIFYSRYASIEHVLSTWDQLVKHSFEHEDLDPRTTSAVLYAFGFTNERTKAIELIKSIPNKSPEILNSFMNGFLDQNDDIEAVTFAVQDIRQQLNF